MKRDIYQKLKEWRSSADRKPLLLQGARQVGKTYSMLHFARESYQDYVYCNFEEDPALIKLFNDQLSPLYLLEQLSFYMGKKISPGESLIIFDEIQLAPRAITSLKYFYEQANDYHVIAAGSLLGVSIGQTTSFPVGKVNFMHLYPLNFLEYLEAIGEQSLALMLMKKSDCSALPDPIHEKLTHYFRIFLFIGGMPEVVNTYSKYRDVVRAQHIQKQIHQSYASDFSKYAVPHESLKVSAIWQTIPLQLVQDNKKFKFNQIEKNARYSRYELAIEWLRKAGLIYLAYHITAASLPLAAYKEPNKFKLYYLDTGLLTSALDIDSRLVVLGDQLYTEFKGALIENYVAKEIASSLDSDLYYWTSNSQAEVDFVVSVARQLYPVEVKSGMTKFKKSLISFQGKYTSQLIIRCSPRNFTKAQSFVNIPLYAACILDRIVEKTGCDNK